MYYMCIFLAEKQYKVPKENIPKGVKTKLDNNDELTTGERKILLKNLYRISINIKVGC